MTEREVWELIPFSQLEKDDVIYMMTQRLTLFAEPWHPEEMRDGLLRIPCRRLDGTEQMAPAFEPDQLVPVRVKPSRKYREARPYRPNTAVQDNDIVGLDVDMLLGRLRSLVGNGELIDPDLVRKLDSALSHGWEPPAAWRNASYATLRTWASKAASDLNSAKASLERLSLELRDRERKSEDRARQQREERP